MFSLAISCLTTSHLSSFVDLRFQVPMQHCSYSIGLYFHHQAHAQLGIVSALAQLLHFFLKLFRCSSPVAYWTSTDLGFVFQHHNFLPFHTVHGIFKARMLKLFAIPFFSEPRPPTPLPEITAKLFGEEIINILLCVIKHMSSEKKFSYINL